METGVREGGVRTVERGALAKTAVYYTTFVVLGFATAVIGPTLPSLAEQTRTSLREVSFLFTALFAGYCAGSLSGGSVYDRAAGHPVMGLALAAMLCMLLLVPLVPVLWVLTAVLLVLGFTEGLLDVGGNILLVWVHGERVGPFMNGLHFAFGLGAFISPLVAAQVMRATGGIRWSYWVLCVLAAPLAVSLFRIPSPRSKTVHRSGTGRKDPLLVALISLLFFMHIGGEIGFGGWLFTYASRMGLARETAAALLTSAFWGSLTLGRLLGVPVVALVKPRVILLASFTGAAAGFALMLAAPGSLAALWTGTVLVGLSIASMVPICFTFAGSCIDMSGRVASWFMVGGSVGTMLIPWLIGQLFEARGPRVTIHVLFVDFAAALLLFLFTLRYASKKACR